MELTNKDLKKTIFKVASGYALAISALWWWSIHLHDQIVETKDAYADEQAKMAQRIGQLEGSIAERELFGNMVLGEVQRGILMAYQIAEENNDK